MPSAAAHLSQLQALLPRGAAWSREAGSTTTKLLSGIAEEFARLDQRGEHLMEELDVRTASEMLGDWERVLGLPDRCAAATPIDLAGRRLQALRKLAYQAGHTPAFYRALAGAMGYDVEIHEFDENVDRFTDYLTPLITDGRWRYVWRVHVLTDTGFHYFRVDEARAGDRLADGGAHDLECVINATKPAHTFALFTYTEF